MSKVIFNNSNKIKGTINNKEVILDIPKEPRIGLSKTKSLCTNCGMIFSFPNHNPTITMANTSLPLDLVFLDKNKTILEIVEGKPYYPYDIQAEGYYVVELNKDFCYDNNINVGDKLISNHPYFQDSYHLTKRKQQTDKYKTVENKPSLSYQKGNKTTFEGGVVGGTSSNPLTVKQSPIRNPETEKETKKTFKQYPMKKYGGSYSLKEELDLFKKGGLLKHTFTKTDSSTRPSLPALKLKSTSTISTPYIKYNYKKGGKVYKDGGKVLLLDGDGIPQMPMEGGERIFSRIHTRELMKIAQEAQSTKNNKELLIKLGRKIAKIVEIHETQEPEYVEG